MSELIGIQIRLFGAFRNLTPLGELSLIVPRHSTVSETKMELQRQLILMNPTFDAAGLLAKSAIADDRRILKDSDKIQNGMRLAVLPPVCGG